MDELATRVDESCDDSPTQSNCRFVDSENGSARVEGCHHSSKPLIPVGNARHNP